MNIWYIHHYGGGPGVGRHFRPWYLAQAWKDQGHETTVFAASFHHQMDEPGRLPSRLEAKDVAYNLLPARPYSGNGLSRLLNMWDFCRAVWRLRRRVGVDLVKPDVVIASSPHPFVIYPAASLARRFGAKLVFEVRDLWPLSVTEINGTSRWHPLVLLIAMTERYAYRRADAVASLLAGVEDYMRECKLPYRRFVWVPNGLPAGDVPAGAPLSAEGRRVCELIGQWKHDGQEIVIHPGSMGAPNALDVLLDAVALLKAQNRLDKITVLLLGSGICRESLEHRAKAEGLDKVHFAGPVPNDEAKYITSLCSIGYCGARNHEAVYRYGISFNKIMDFLSAGLPMILPIEAKVAPDGVTLKSVIKTSCDARGVAEAIVALSKRTASERKEDAEEARRVAGQLFDYSSISRRYLGAL